MRGHIERGSSRALSCAIAWVVIACGSPDPAPTPGHGRGPFSAAPVAAAAPSTPPPISRTHGRPSDPFDHGVVGPEATPRTEGITSTTTVAEAVPTSDEVQRDLAADLASAIGSPAGCIDLETARALHGRLAIRVTATVMPTGTITRATANGTGLSAAALECVEARALNAHLVAPVEGAPRGISTTIAYEVATTEDTRTITTPDFVPRPGTVAPGVVTPAVGPAGPVAGSVTPSSTLPAMGGAGRPEGSVAPDLVLPARRE